MSAQRVVLTSVLACLVMAGAAWGQEVGWTFMQGQGANLADSGVEIVGGQLHFFVGTATITENFVWQELTLQGGTTYDVTGHWNCALEWDDGAWWTQLVMTDGPPPVEGDEWVVTPLLEHTESTSPPPFDEDIAETYTVPGSGDVTVICGFKSGTWGDHAYDAYVDEISVQAQGSEEEELVNGDFSVPSATRTTSTSIGGPARWSCPRIPVSMRR